MLPSQEQTLQVQPLTSSDQLEILYPEWQDLYLRDPSATPFQSPAWLLPWWRHLGRGELLSLALRDASKRLVAFLPLYVSTRAPGIRTLLPLGVATSDYLDGIFEPDVGLNAGRAAFAYLDTVRDRWHRLDLQHLRDSSPLLTASMPASWADEIFESAACPVLALPESVKALQERLSARMAHNLLFYRRRAARQGLVEYTRAHSGNLDCIWSAHLRLHRARWRARGQGGVLTDDAVLRAHQDSLPMLLGEDLLRLYALRVDGQIIATLYGLLGKRGPERRFYYYLAGFDPEFDKLSPGTLLIGHVMEQAIIEGCRAFDFLAGQEPYKYLWGAMDTILHGRSLQHRGQAEAGGATLSKPARGARDRFSLHLDASVRPCERADLPTLEWFGMFDRKLIDEIFVGHERGEAIMLVAEVNSVPSGQAWIALDPDGSIGFLWALRVFPALQRQGIGSRLVAASERMLVERGYSSCEVSVEPQNEVALRLYQRLGYVLLGPVPRERKLTNPGPCPVGAVPQLLLRKRLSEKTGERHGAIRKDQQRPRS